MRAYFYAETSEDQRAEHDSQEPISVEDLKKLGVLYWNTQNVEAVNQVSTERGYKNRDEIVISQQAMGDIYIQKITSFFEEHLHEDEEIRWILEGSGYFDVRDGTDKRWIRIKVEKGDLLVLPPGIFHRFTVDNKDYIKAMRLFKDEPKWLAINRSKETDTNPFRQAYIDQVRQAGIMSVS